MDKFKSVIAGKERLVVTYWLWGVVGTIAVSFVAGLLVGLLGLPVVIGILITLAYWIPVAFGIWRSSDNYKGNPVWAILAKVAVVLGALSVVYQIFTSF